MAADDDLAVTSLRGALQAAMKEPPHAAVRFVTVRGVSMGQAAALQAFLNCQDERGLWKVRNARRLANLVAVDDLLRALTTDLAPFLVDNPASQPELGLLRRYSHYFKSKAVEVGGTFAKEIDRLADALLDHANIASGMTNAGKLLTRTQNIGKLLRGLRTRELTISAKPDADEPASDDDDDEPMAFDVDVTSLRDALQEAADHPGAGRRVNVTAVKLIDAAPLRAVLRLQVSERGWAVRGLGSLATLAAVDSCFHAVEAEFIDIARNDPTRAAPLAVDFTRYIKGEAAKVEGRLLKRTNALCDTFLVHVNGANHLAAAEMQKSTYGLRRSLGFFRSRRMSITPASDNSDGSDSSDGSASSGSDGSASSGSDTASQVAAMGNSYGC